MYITTTTFGTILRSIHFVWLTMEEEPILSICEALNTEFTSMESDYSTRMGPETPETDPVRD